MRLVTTLLKHAVYPALHHTGCLDRIPPIGGFAVVNYHGIVPVRYSSSDAFLDGNLLGPEVLRQQLQFLKDHYHVIHPEDFRAWVEHGKQLPPRAVLLTCDDGLVNNLTEMLPLLQSESVTCLFFVTGASCVETPGMLWYEELYLLMRAKPLEGSDLQLPVEEGTTPASSEDFQASWWSAVRSASRLDEMARADWMARVRVHCGLTVARSEHVSEHTSEHMSEQRWRLMNVCELRQLVDAGMSIGAHTLSHPVLSLCGEKEARREIERSKADLEEALEKPVWAFAYPFGNPATLGEREIRLAQEAGFSCAFLNVERWRAENSNPFALPRIHVTSQTTLPEFAAHLSGLHSRLQHAVGG